MHDLVESMGGIILRTSLLNLDVKVSPHPASETRARLLLSMWR